jgi:hypothetical protein
LWSLPWRPQISLKLMVGNFNMRARELGNCCPEASGRAFGLDVDI